MLFHKILQQWKFTAMLYIDDFNINIVQFPAIQSTAWLHTSFTSFSSVTTATACLISTIVFPTEFCMQYVVKYI